MNGGRAPPSPVARGRITVAADICFVWVKIASATI
jgi:hypothetical protein